MVIVRLGILCLWVRGVLGRSFETVTKYPEHELYFKTDVKVDEVFSRDKDDIDVLVEESMTQYDIGVFMRMLKKKKKMFPTRPAYVMFY